MTSPARFDVKRLGELTIDDEASFWHVGLYGDLKAVLVASDYRFRVLPEGSAGRWDRALALNLTFWGTDDGGDILESSRIAADVVAHVAWHHLAARAFPAKEGVRPSADALFLGESIASAFDVYLVGRLLGHAPDSSFLETQVPRMADAAADAGVSEDDFEAMLGRVAEDPERAFNDLRALLFDAVHALFVAGGAEEALGKLADLEKRPMGALLHRYELSNWALYARAYSAGTARDSGVLEVDAALRAGDGLEWLTRSWVAPGLR